MIKYRQLIEKTMPENKKISASKDILGFYILRPIENVISIPLIEKGIAATSVTILSFYIAILAFIAFLIPGKAGFWSGWILILIWNLCDGIDGNIARFTDTCSAKGELWDATAGWIATVSFYFGMGIEAYYLPGIEPIHIPAYFYIIMGCMSGMFWIFPRAVMHKKAGIMGASSVESVKGRSGYSIAKTFLHNITSINGFGAVAFLLSFLFRLNALCMVCYFFLSATVCIGSLCSLLCGEEETE